NMTAAAANEAVDTNPNTIKNDNAGNTIGEGTATARIIIGRLSSVVDSSTCSYTGGAATASCTVVITSATTGTTMVSATSSIPLTGDGSVSRTTNGTAGNSGPASKERDDARLDTSPAPAPYAVGRYQT